MSEESSDARQVRTRAALAAAAIELASEMEIPAITVTALAKRAGVHRSTVYEHGGSPRGVLRRAFGAELDELRESMLRDIAPAETARALQRVTLAVFAHVERYATVYRNIERMPDSAVQPFLSSHFRKSLRLLLEQESVVVPTTVPGATPGFVEEAVVRFISDGLVGLVMTWLHNDARCDPETALALIYELLPAWWPRQR